MGDIPKASSAMSSSDASASLHLLRRSSRKRAISEQEKEAKRKKNRKHSYTPGAVGSYSSNSSPHNELTPAAGGARGRGRTTSRSRTTSPRTIPLQTIVRSGSERDRRLLAVRIPRQQQQQQQQQQEQFHQCPVVTDSPSLPSQSLSPNASASEDLEVRCKMVVWSLSDIKLDKGTCEARFRITLFWAPPATHSAAICQAHVSKHGVAVRTGPTVLHWSLNSTRDDCFATYTSLSSSSSGTAAEGTRSLTPSTLVESSSLSPHMSSSSSSSLESELKIEYPKLSLINADFNHETSDKPEVASILSPPDDSIGEQTPVMRYTQMVIATMNLTGAFDRSNVSKRTCFAWAGSLFSAGANDAYTAACGGSSSGIYQFPFDSHQLRFAMQIRAGSFKRASLRPANLSDNINSRVYPYGFLNLPLESTEFKFKEDMEWEVILKTEKSKSTGDILMTREELCFLVFIWRKHHYYLMNIIFCDLVRKIRITEGTN